MIANIVYEYPEGAWAIYCAANTVRVTIMSISSIRPLISLSSGIPGRLIETIIGNDPRGGNVREIGHPTS